MREIVINQDVFMFVVCTNIATLLQIVYDSRTANCELRKKIFEKDLPQDALPTTNLNTSDRAR